MTPTRGARRRRGRPRLASPEARRHQILDAAVRQLANAGDRSVTIDSIAKEAGLVRAQIYEIFPSRDGLFEAALEREASRINDYLLVAGRRAFELPLPERVRALYRSIFDYGEIFPDSLKLVCAHVASTTGTGPARWRDQVARRIRADFGEAGFPSQQLPDVLATMLMGLVEATARRTFEEPGWDPDAIVEFLAIFSLGGFAALMDAPDEARAVDAPKSHEHTAHQPAD